MILVAILYPVASQSGPICIYLGSLGRRCSATPLLQWRRQLYARRQNSSCDPCRRSKRRCFFPIPGCDELSAACTHCRRLGHACTFDFAASRLNSRTKRRQRRDPPRSDQIAGLNEPYDLNETPEIFADSANNILQIGAADDQGNLTAWLDLDIDHFFDCNASIVPGNTSQASQFYLHKQTPRQHQGANARPSFSFSKSAAQPTITSPI